jgi:hypothetical protein
MIDSIKKYDVITAIKKSRVKPYGDIKVAIKDRDYLVTSVYVNNFGTKKLYLVDESGFDFIISENAASKKFSLYSGSAKPQFDYKLWFKAKKLWMDRTYVPVYLTHFYDYSGYPMVMSRDSESALVADIRKTDNKFWISKEYVHIEDIKSFFTSSMPPENPNKNNTPSGAVSVRIPLWLAKKNSIFK